MMMNFHLKIKDLKWNDIYLPALFVVTIISTLIINIALSMVTDGEFFGRIFVSPTNDTFMDHFNSVYDCYDGNPYSHKVIYPPLANLFYLMCAKLTPNAYFETNWYTFPGGNDIRFQSSAMMIMIAVIISTVLLIFVMFGKLLKDKGINNKIICFLFPASMAFSYPVLFTIERGNIVLLSVCFLMIFVVFYNSHNKYLRELAYISLAISVGLKIYPVVMGLILIFEKQWKAVIKVLLYGILFFFGPFVFFDGYHGLNKLLSNLVYNTYYLGEFGYGYKVSFENFFSAMNDLLFSGTVNVVAVKVAAIAIIFLCTLTALITKKRWTRFFMLTILSINLVSISYSYSLMFLLIPLFYFIKEYKVTSFRHLCFALIFTIPFIYVPPVFSSIFAKININSLFNFNMDMLFKNTALLAICIILITHEIYSFIKRRKKITASD